MNVYLINNNKKGGEKTGRCGGNNRKSVNANTVKDKDLFYNTSIRTNNSLSLKIKMD